MKEIYYLCYSDRKEIDGLLFPNELFEETYAPGLWVVDLLDFERFPDSFNFKAVDNDEVINFKMTRVNDLVYQVDIPKYGKFYFRIITTFFLYNKYKGNSNLINKKSRLYQVVSMDIQKLHRTCLEKRFFFVGRVDDDLK